MWQPDGQPPSPVKGLGLSHEDSPLRRLLCLRKGLDPFCTGGQGHLLVIGARQKANLGVDVLERVVHFL